MLRSIELNFQGRPHCSMYIAVKWTSEIYQTLGVCVCGENSLQKLAKNKNKTKNPQPNPKHCFKTAGLWWEDGRVACWCQERTEAENPRRVILQSWDTARPWPPQGHPNASKASLAIKTRLDSWSYCYQWLASLLEMWAGVCFPQLEWPKIPNWILWLGLGR